MKNKTLIFAAVTAGAALLIYFLTTRKSADEETINDSIPESVPQPRTHHLTDVFAHAKQQAE